MDNSEQKQPNLLQGSAREKYWEERSADERIMALHRNLVWALSMVERLSNQVYDLQRHQHAETGKLMVPLFDDRNENGPRRSRIPYDLQTKRDRGD